MGYILHLYFLFFCIVVCVVCLVVVCALSAVCCVSVASWVLLYTVKPLMFGGPKKSPKKSNLIFIVIFWSDVLINSTLIGQFIVFYLKTQV